MKRDWLCSHGMFVGDVSPLLCGFQALIIGDVTVQEVICPGFHNRVNIYDTEPGLRFKFSRCELVGWEFFEISISKLALPRLHIRCEVISLTPHGGSIAFETRDTMYLVGEQNDSSDSFVSSWGVRLCLTIRPENVTRCGFL
jgi:hypothetical protein